MNTIYLAGQVLNTPKFSHECYGEKFYKFNIGTGRISGVEDSIPCTIAEVYLKNVVEFANISVFGEVRSGHENGRLNIEVFVKEINEYEEDRNDFDATGYICTQPTYRKTPMGREISDIMIAVHRERFGKSDYIPLVAWGRNAVYASNMEIGTKINVSGRLQEREYKKTFPNGEVEYRTVYEVSVTDIEGDAE